EPGDFARMARQDLRFRAGRIIFLEARDFLEQLGSPRVVEPATWDALLGTGQSSKNFLTERGVRMVWQTRAFKPHWRLPPNGGRKTANGRRGEKNFGSLRGYGSRA